MTYLECPKKFELSVILNMPQIGAFDEVEENDEEGEDLESTGSALNKGSYLHRILELFIINQKTTIDEINVIAKGLQETEFSGKVTKKDYSDAIELCKVFLERNLEKITSSKKQETEIDINFDLEGYRIHGKVDRVDYLKDKLDGFVDIIDYKTNKHSISLEKRKVQLGLYALGLMDQGYKVNKIVLDMLKLDSPVEMIINNDNQDEVTSSLGCDSRSNFTITEFKQLILDTCKKIEKDYEHDFIPIDDKGKCKFCGYKFYCPKWRTE
jgi:CRISPR/Cas system-associated exonuclease Cas4 (RecB family)